MPRPPRSTGYSPGDELMDADAAAAYLTIPKATVYDLVQMGKLAHLRLGPRKGLRFTRAQLDEWLASKAVAVVGRRPTGDAA